GVTPNKTGPHRHGVSHAPFIQHWASNCETRCPFRGMLSSWHMKSEKSQAARQLLLQESFGVLSTISIDVPGYPFGSVTPYCVDRECRPIVYISTIAQHTKNILADSKVSLTIVEASSDSDDVQARGRLTVLADAKPVTRSDTSVRDRYLRHFP